MKKGLTFLSLLIVVTLTFSACGGYTNESSIHVKDSISGENFSINIRVQKAAAVSPFMHFAINKNINELAAEISKIDPALAVKVYQDKFILIKTASNFFLLKQIDKLDVDTEESSRYWFFSPIGLFEVDTPIGDISTIVLMYIPYHMLKDIVVQLIVSSEEAYPETIECEAIGTRGDFINFYNHFGAFGVEEDNDSIIVTNKENEVKMRVSFSEEGGISKVSFTILKTPN